MTQDQQAASRIVIRRARADEAIVFRTFRLRALADAPQAFSTTLAEAEAMHGSVWEQRVSDGAAGVKSVMMVAADASTDVWLGMTVGVRDPDDAALAHVVSVWVAPEARRSGAARRLLEAVHDWARARSVRMMRLGVADTNVAARRLYEGAGYRETGELHPLAAHPGLHELTMECSL
jgi:ribosomal protein S18 acetylase RimI-like enzyme